MLPPRASSAANSASYSHVRVNSARSSSTLQSTANLLSCVRLSSGVIPAASFSRMPPLLARVSPRSRNALSLVLFFQAADDELRTISRQDLLFSGLLMAIVDSFFLLRPPRRQLLIFGRNRRWLTRARGAIQAL